MSEKDTEANNIKMLEAFVPSWFDRFTLFMDRLPGPYGLAYLLFGAVLAAIGLIVQGFDPAQGTLGFEPLELLILFQIVFVLTLITYLNKNGARAMEAFRPAFKGNEEQAALIKLHLTSMPARSLNYLTIIFFLVFTFLGYLMVRYMGSAPDASQLSVSVYSFTPTPFGYYAVGMWILVWLINTILIFNTVQQLRTINYAYTHHAEINLFRQSELYAFSRVLATRSIGFVLTSPIWLLVDTGIITLIINIVFAILALIIFVVPLVGVHRLLEAQKEVLSKQSAQSKGLMIHQLFAHLENGEINEAASLKDGLSSVVLAHEQITKASTWPWQTNTLRQIAGAITLPIVIWLIQFFLSRVLET
jgi:hypothetical protein